MKDYYKILGVDKKSTKEEIKKIIFEYEDMKSQIAIEELEEFNKNEQNALVLNTLIDLRSLAIWAYKTSEVVGKNILAYDPIPGVQKGCISLELYNPEYRKREPKAFLAEAIEKTRCRF